nr:uncharacterized protein LOC109184888 [Ipomoea batatas]
MTEAQILNQMGSSDPVPPHELPSTNIPVVEKEKGPSSSKSPKAPWADLFRKSKETVDVAFNLSFCPPVNGRFPGLDSIDALVKSWKMKCRSNPQSNGFVLFRFQSEEDKCSIISSGNPICMDKVTKIGNKKDYARILVEIYSSIPPLVSVPVLLPNGETIHQVVSYEVYPRFCMHCKSVKHYKEQLPETRAFPKFWDRRAARQIENYKRLGLEWRWKNIVLADCHPDLEVGNPVGHSLNQGGVGLGETEGNVVDCPNSFEIQGGVGLGETEGIDTDCPSSLGFPPLEPYGIKEVVNVSPVSEDPVTSNGNEPMPLDRKPVVDDDALMESIPRGISSTTIPMDASLLHNAIIPQSVGNIDNLHFTKLARPDLGSSIGMEIVPFNSSVVVSGDCWATAGGCSRWEAVDDSLLIYSSSFPSLGPFAFDKEIMVLHFKANKASREFAAFQLEANRVCKKFVEYKRSSSESGSGSHEPVNSPSQPIDFKAALLSPPKVVPNQTKQWEKPVVTIRHCLFLFVQSRCLKAMAGGVPPLLLLNDSCNLECEGLSTTKVDRIVKGIFPSEEVFVDYNTIRSGRIVIVWNANKVDYTIVKVFPQCVHYLLQFQQVTNYPWIVCGDFNVMKGPAEKIRGVIPTTYFTKDFVERCNALNLADAPCIGNFFTWTNGRVKAKLDRVMLDANCREAVNRPFKFFNMWLAHPSFPQILSDAWMTVISGTNQYVFVQHLKCLKAPLKRLNKEEFGHISEKARRVNEEFSQFVHNFDVLTTTNEDRQKLQLLRKQACFYAKVECQFFSQKLKLKNLIDGQKGTKFFYDLVKSNRDFFKDLLGSSRNRMPCRVDFLSNGLLIISSQHAVLTREVSNQEIKDALFDVDDQKAPRPDGYSAAFFKNNWEMIREDLTDAVREFFQSRQLLKQINYTVIALIPKTQQTNVVGDFRPISCCNVIYKVISKVLAARLSNVLPSLIDHA